MLKMFPQYDTLEGLSVYQDHEAIELFYVLPDAPRFRIDRDTGRPVFRFLKYRTPIDRPGGKKGGGFVVFDSEFAVPDEKMNKIRQTLQERVNQQFGGRGPTVKVAQPSYLRGEAALQLISVDGSARRPILNPGAPSLFGNMICPFSVELSPEDATLLEQALQGQGGIVQVVYGLTTLARLPDVKVHIWFRSEKFMDFQQTVDIDWSMWGDDSYHETIQEKFVNTDSGDVHLEPGSLDRNKPSDAKILDQLRNWGFATLEDAVKRMVLGDIPAVGEDRRKVPDGIEHVYRHISVDKVASFDRTFTEGQVMEWDPKPRGTMPNITAMLGRDGQPFRWADYAKTVDLDDPFFKTLSLTVRTNADFSELPIDSVEVKVSYSQGETQRSQEYLLVKADDVGKFESYTENSIKKYKYRYQVNFKGAGRAFVSPELEDEGDGILTVNVDDTGVFLVKVSPNNFNWDEVTAAQVSIKYEDAANGVDPFEEVVTLSKTAASGKVQRVIFQPRRNPYQYRTKYVMKDGRTLQSEWQPGRSRELTVDSPFGGRRTVGFRASGDLDAVVDQVYVDASYADPANSYTQTLSFVLDASNKFKDWAFPVVSEAGGKVTYRGNVRLKTGAVIPIAETEAASATVLVGLPAQTVEITPELVNFARVQLVEVSLRFADPANRLEETEEFLFRKPAAGGSPSSVKWTFAYLNSAAAPQYTWQATYYLLDGSTRDIPATTTSSKKLILRDAPA